MDVVGVLNFHKLGVASRHNTINHAIKVRFAKNQEVSTIKNRYEQEEQNRLNAEIQKFSSNVDKYPHFELVREEMAQLLEQGKAQDLKSAYERAVWLVPEVRELEVQKLAKKANPQASQAQKVAKAKAAAVSPRSVTPNGTVANSTEKKDRKAILAEQMEANGSSRV